MTLAAINLSLKTADNNGQIKLDLSSLQEERLIQLLSSHLMTTEILVSNAKLTSNNKKATLKGQADFLNLVNQNIEIQFTEEGGTVQMVLKTLPAATWTLKDSFPSLENISSLLPDFSNPQLILSSFEFEQEKLAFPVREGLNMVLDMAVNGPLQPLRSLLDETQNIQFQGNIIRSDTGNSFHLISKLPSAFQFGHVSLKDVTVALTADETVTSSLSASWKVGGQPLVLNADISGGASSLHAQIEPVDLQFDNFSILESIVPGVDLKGAVPPEFPAITTFRIVQLELDLNLGNKAIDAIALGIEIPGSWKVIPEVFSVQRPAVFWNITQPASSESRSIDMQLIGYLVVSDISTPVVFSVPSLEMNAMIQQINFTQLAQVALKNTPIPEVFPALSFSNLALSGSPKTGALSFSGQSSSNWQIPIGPDVIEIGDLKLDLHTGKGSNGKRTSSGSLEGMLALGANSFKVNYNFPGDFVLQCQIPSIGLSPLLQDLGGSKILQGVPIPMSILQAQLQDIELTIAPQQQSFQIAGGSDLGQMEISIEPKSGGGYGFSMGITPAANWKFSQIDSALSVLDGLNFDGTTLVVSSADDTSLSMNVPGISEDNVSVRKGLNFFAQLDMSGLGVDQLMNIRSLQVYSAIGSNPRNLVIEASVPGSFPIQENISFGEITFRLQPSPTEFSVTLLGTLSAVLDTSPLRFIGGLGIKIIPGAFQANMQATMLGVWANPFGTQGLSIADVAVELGIAFPPVRPSIGIAGTLQIGNFLGSVALKFDSGNPGKSMVAVAFNQLVLMDIFSTFCPPHIVGSVPREMTQVLNKTRFEEVGVYIVPQPTSIGALHYEQGISLQGRMNIFDLNVSAYLKIDPSSGILINAEMDPINVGGILKITGAAGDPKPSLFLDLRMGSIPSVDITGAVELLGLRLDAKIVISDAGFYFMTGGKLFNLFEASIEVEGKDFINGDGISVKASMKNDLFLYLRTEASKAIEAAAKAAMQEISDAQQTITNAQNDINRLTTSINQMRQTVQRERDRDIQRLQDARRAVQGEQNKVNTLLADINNMRKTVQVERERDAKRVTDARNVVTGAQNKVDGLQREIDNMRRTIQAERDRDAARIRSAQDEVNKAQGSVNSIQGQINSSKARIDQLAADIRAKKRWLDAKPWFDKGWAGIEYSAYAAAKTAEQGAIYTKIGGLETAKHTALAALEVAKQVLRGIQAAAKSFPIDTDPRIVGLFTAKGTATAALTVAKEALRGLEATIKSFPIDADPRVAALITAHATANAALEVAKQTVRAIEAAAKTFPIDADPRVASMLTAQGAAIGVLEAAKLTLEGVKQSVGGVANVGQFIVNAGLGGLIDIREASFAGRLSALNGGGVSLYAKLTFMNKPVEARFDFDFKDPIKGALSLAEKLLEA